MAMTTREMAYPFGDASPSDVRVRLSSKSVDEGFDAEGSVATTKPTKISRVGVSMLVP